MVMAVNLVFFQNVIFDLESVTYHSVILVAHASCKLIISIQVPGPSLVSFVYCDVTALQYTKITRGNSQVALDQMSIMVLTEFIMESGIFECSLVYSSQLTNMALWRWPPS